MGFLSKAQTPPPPFFFGILQTVSGVQNQKHISNKLIHFIYIFKDKTIGLGKINKHDQAMFQACMILAIWSNHVQKYNTRFNNK